MTVWIRGLMCLAAAIRAGMKAYELIDLDLAYAPPYSSAKDPVNMAGLYRLKTSRTVLVKQWYYEDDRNASPRWKRHASRHTHTDGIQQEGMWKDLSIFPLTNCVNASARLDKTKPVYVICQSGSQKLYCKSDFNRQRF